MQSVNTKVNQKSTQLDINDVEIRYGNHLAVNKVSLSLRQGEIGCLLGPSGCGKTSLQRAIAGFEPLASGKIELAEKLVSGPGVSVNPELRNVGMVFQDFALFPHLNVERNIGFGLRKLDSSERQARIDEALEMIGLKEYAKRFPHELSGGQQQRVALARAIAPQPDILLLDEPFSSLDANLREFIAKEVRRILKKHNITAILVTHDQHEAFALADKVGVMNQGQLLQWDKPYHLYHNPKNRFIANFVGEGNVIHATVNANGQLENALGVVAEKIVAEAENVANNHTRISGNDQQQCWKTDHQYGVLVRPDDIVYAPDSDIKLTIVDRLFRGAEYLYQLQLDDGQCVLCVAPSHLELNIGDQLPVVTDLKHLVIFED